jgi:hypothetical protein
VNAASRRRAKKFLMSMNGKSIGFLLTGLGVAAAVGIAIVHYGRRVAPPAAPSTSTAPAAASSPALPAPAATREIPPPPASAPMADLSPDQMAARASAIIENPQAIATLARMNAISAENEFGELMDVLKLSSAERKAFLRIVGAARTKESTIGMKVLAGASGEERQALEAEAAAVRAKMDEDIRALVQGEESFALYRDYLEQKPARAHAAELTAAVRESGEPLSAEQAAQLKAIVHEERRPPGTGGAGHSEATAVDFGRPEFVAARTARLEEFHRRIEQRAAGLLTPTQLSALKASQDARRERLRSTFGR